MDRAKAVITIWTPEAFELRWVKAEALRAFDQNKLLNVHTPDVKPSAIMMPFNGEHISPISNRAAIYKALAKLGVRPQMAALAPKPIRDASEAALAFEHIKDLSDIEDFEAFLADFSDGGRQFYIRLAKKKIAELSARGVAISVGVTIRAAGTAAGIATASAVCAAAEVPLPKEGDVFLRIEPGMHTAGNPAHWLRCSGHTHGYGFGRQDGATVGVAAKRAR